MAGAARRDTDRRSATPIWFRLDVLFLDDDKVIDVGEEHDGNGVAVLIALLTAAKAQEAVAAVPGQIAMGWRQLARAAFVPGRSAEEARTIVATCVDVGLVADLEDDGRAFTCRVVGWGRRQRPADPAAIFRHRPELRVRVRERDGERCRFCAVVVNFEDRRSDCGGTYVIVDAGLAIDLQNIVVACRACAAAHHDGIKPRDPDSTVPDREPPSSDLDASGPEQATGTGTEDRTALPSEGGVASASGKVELHPAVAEVLAVFEQVPDDSPAARLKRVDPFGLHNEIVARPDCDPVAAARAAVTRASDRGQEASARMFGWELERQKTQLLGRPLGPGRRRRDTPGQDPAAVGAAARLFPGHDDPARIRGLVGSAMQRGAKADDEIRRFVQAVEETGRMPAAAAWRAA